MGFHKRIWGRQFSLVPSRPAALGGLGECPSIVEIMSSHFSALVCVLVGKSEKSWTLSVSPRRGDAQRRSQVETTVASPVQDICEVYVPHHTPLYSWPKLSQAGASLGVYRGDSLELGTLESQTSRNSLAQIWNFWPMNPPFPDSDRSANFCLDLQILHFFQNLL